MTPVEILQYIVMGALALLGSPLITWLKTKFGWKDVWASLLAGAVAAVLAIVELLISGGLTLADFTLENFAVAFTAVYTVAQAWYSLFKDRSK